eukprot:6491765-Amphidinium_carterae.2
MGIGVVGTALFAYLAPDAYYVMSPYVQEFLVQYLQDRPSPPSSSDNVAKCSPHACEDAYWALDYWYGYYGSQVYVQRDVCDCNIFELKMGKGWRLAPCVGMAWIGAFVLMLGILNSSVIGKYLPCGGFLAGACRCCSCCLQGLRADCLDVSNACIFLISELLLILARRTPVAKQRLRKLAMRMRPYAPASILTGDPVHVVTPAGSPAAVRDGRVPGSTSSRRSLLQIQAAQNIVTGGHKMGKVRIRLPRRRRWVTTYNPRATRGDCLFMAMCRALRNGSASFMHVPTPAVLRAQVQEHAKMLLNTHESIWNGRSLAWLLQHHGIDRQQYIGMLTGPRRRWGNTLDVAVCAHLYQVPLRLSHIGTGKVLFQASHTGRPFMDIGYRGHHFVAGRRKEQPGRLDDPCVVLSSLRRNGLVILCASMLVKSICCWCLAASENTLVEGGDPSLAVSSQPHTGPSMRPLQLHQCITLQGQSIQAAQAQYSFSALSWTRGIWDAAAGLYSFSSSYSSHLCADDLPPLVCGGAPGQVAGTGNEVLDAEGENLAHPFLLPGASESENDDADYMITNGHDLAIFLARHRGPFVSRSVQSPAGALASTSSASSSCDLPSLGSTFDNCTDSEADSDTDQTPRAVRIMHLRGLLRWLASTPVAKDLANEELSYHTWGNPLYMSGLDDDFEQGRLTLYSSCVPDADAYDNETGYDDFEDETTYAARDRRVSLLRTHLELAGHGVPFQPEVELPCLGVDGSHGALLNPAELQRLLWLSRSDTVDPDPDFMPRDVGAELSLEEQFEIENLFSFVRFLIIAFKPRLQCWWRVDRTPLTVDDLLPEYTPGLEDHAWHAWENPHRVTRMERSFVDNWQRERHRIRAERAEQLAAGLRRAHPGPVTDDAASSYGPVCRLRTERRANAAPVQAYDERLEADLIGDLLFAEGGGKNTRFSLSDVVPLRELRALLSAVDGAPRLLSTLGVVHGGGGTSSGKGSSSAGRRPYPFATTVQSRAGAAANTGDGVMTPPREGPPAADDVPPPTFVLVYHGSFAPMHAGHRECIHTALRFLVRQGVYIKRAVIGFTLPDYVLKKTLDSAFSDLSIRVAVAKEVLATGAPLISPIELDCVGQQTSFALACKYASDETVIYLEGSDLRIRPAKEVLLVTRSTKELCGAAVREFFDPATASGFCLQRSMLNVTSTKVRAALEGKTMPLIYSEKAQQLIKDFLGWKGVLRPIPLKGTKMATAASSSSAGAEAKKVKPASKRVAAKSAITLTERPLAATGSTECKQEQLDSRPPLKRLRSTSAEQTIVM